MKVKLEIVLDTEDPTYLTTFRGIANVLTGQPTSPGVSETEHKAAVKRLTDAAKAKSEEAARKVKSKRRAAEAPLRSHDTDADAPADDTPADDTPAEAPKRRRRKKAEDKTESGTEVDIDQLSGEALEDAVADLNRTVLASGKRGVPKRRQALKKFLQEEFDVDKFSELSFDEDADDEWTQEDADEALRDVYRFLQSL